MALSTPSTAKFSIEHIISLLFIIAAAFFNLQFLSGANLNSSIAGHDEYLTIKDVYSILEPLSMKHFFLAVMHGSFLAYGSLMFYVDALIAFVPYKLFGLDGMIYAIRMGHAFFLVLGISLLSRTFLTTTRSKVLFMLSALLVAHSFYFAMMPKPEPMQLFFFALFLYYAKKRDWAFGKHFIWIGIALGLKITLLIFLPFLFLIPFLIKGRIEIKGVLLPGLKAGAFFLLGFLLAVPYLLLAVARPSYLNSFLDANIRNTSKIYDKSSITLTDWIGNGLGEPYLGMELIGYVFVAILSLVLACLGYRMVQERRFNAIFLIALLGLTFILFIGLKVDRLWPHYLWMGYVLAILAFNQFYDQERKKTFKTSLLIVNSVILMLVLIQFASVNYQKYFLIENDLELRQRVSDAESLFGYIDENYEEGIKIGTDGTVFYPYSQFVIANVYHPFSDPLPEASHNQYNWYVDEIDKIWEKPNSLVVFGERHPVKDFETLRKQFPHWDNEGNQKKYNNKLSSNFELDTVIGTLEVYRRIE